MKLSKAMQENLDKLINAPYADYEPNAFFYLEESPTRAPHDGGKRADGTIRMTNVTSTLKALEKRGLIEIVSIGYMDTIRLLQHENTSKSLHETRKLTPVRVYTNSSGRIVEDRYTSYVENDNIENILRYWDHTGFRDKVAKVVNKNTGEVMYEAAD